MFMVMKQYELYSQRTVPKGKADISHDFSLLDMHAIPNSKLTSWVYFLYLGSYPTLRALTLVNIITIYYYYLFI